MNKIKIINEDSITKIFLNDKELQGVVFFNLEQSVASVPELHLILRGNLDVEMDNPIIIKDEEEYESTYQLAREISNVFDKNIKFEYSFKKEEE